MSVDTVASREDEFWERIFPHIARKAAEREPELLLRLDLYALELRRFLTLARSSNVPLAMVSTRIDALWHEFINATIVYRDYCREFAGRFIDHMSRSEWFPIPEAAVESFVSQYNQRYGALSDVWFDGASPSVAKSLRQGSLPPGLRWSGYVPPRYAAKLWIASEIDA
ncbi:hypothetical protein BH10PSE14_BH10PSE14_28780 [soil metagenome]